MRIDKLIESSMNTSRKEMKRLFLRGVVVIDGKKTRNESLNVDSQLHEIVVEGKQLSTNDSYYLLNKPKGYVTATKDLMSKTVMDLIQPSDISENLYAVGRLDRDSQGLVFLTTNGPLGYALLHPTKKVSKKYEVIVNAKLTQEDVDRFAKGIVFHGGVQCKPARLELGECLETMSQAWVTIEEGKFHQIKKMFLSCGKKVTQLKRLSIGPLELGMIREGEYRALTLEELKKLKPYFFE